MIQLTKKQAILYKQRWQQVESMQTQELRAMPMSLKFKQLCFLINSFDLTSEDKKREKDVAIVRKSWVRLKKKMGR